MINNIKKPDLFIILKRRKKSVQQFLQENVSKTEISKEKIKELLSSYTLSADLLKEIDNFVFSQKEAIKSKIEEEKITKEEASEKIDKQEKLTKKRKQSFVE